MNRTSVNLGIVVGSSSIVLALVLLSYHLVFAPSSSPRAPGQQSHFTPTPPVPAQPQDRFTDVTAQAGITFVHQFCDKRIANILESNGSGGAVLDYDQDGFVDIYLVNAGPLEGVTHHAPGTVRQPNRLYRNQGDGTFADVTQSAGVAGRGYGTAAAVGDFDNNGFPDLYVVNVGTNILYRNRGDGTFEDVTAASGTGHPGTGISAVFLDYDNDGWLDLFVANYLTYDPQYNLYFNPDSYPGPLAYEPELNALYRNRGNGTFAEVGKATGACLPGHRAMSVCTLDYNLDGHADLYLANDATPNVLLVNDGHGQFTDQGLRLGVAMNAIGEAAGSMAAAVGDCNNDGYPDILVTRLGYGSLYLGSSQGFFEDQMNASGLGALTAQFVAWGGCFLDFDNDTDLDIFIANGSAHYLAGWESLLLENQGQARYTDAAKLGGVFFQTRVRGRGSAVLDYNNDGQMDVLVTTLADRPFLLQNRGTPDAHWLTLVLQGTKSNRDGYGTHVRATVAGKVLVAEQRPQTGFLMQGDSRLHFGLGRAAMVQHLELRWPSGARQALENVAADQILKLTEP